MIFKKKQTCNLCGVTMPWGQKRCPKCGYSFRTLDRLDSRRVEIERALNDAKYGVITNLSATYVRIKDIDADIINVTHQPF